MYQNKSKKFFSKQNIKWIILISLTLIFLALTITGFVMMNQPETITLNSELLSSTSLVKANQPTWIIVAALGSFFLLIVLIVVFFELYQAKQRRRIARKLSKDND